MQKDHDNYMQYDQDNYVQYDQGNLTKSKVKKNCAKGSR